MFSQQCCHIGQQMLLYDIDKTKPNLLEMHNICSAISTKCSKQSCTRSFQILLFQFIFSQQCCHIGQQMLLHNIDKTKPNLLEMHNICSAVSTKCSKQSCTRSF